MDRTLRSNNGSLSLAIGVAGAHGKTTATSMLSIMMSHAKLDPTILVGGELDEIGGNVKTGESEYFITEACEYMDSFLKFHPFMAIILNIDEDHLDYFKDINRLSILCGLCQTCAQVRLCHSQRG